MAASRTDSCYSGNRSWQPGTLAVVASPGRALPRSVGALRIMRALTNPVNGEHLAGAKVRRQKAAPFDPDHDSGSMAPLATSRARVVGTAPARPIRFPGGRG